MKMGAELILFTAPEMGHLIAEVEVGRRLVELGPDIYVTILVPKLPVPIEKLNASIRTLQADLQRDGSHQRISLVELPQVSEIPPEVICKGPPVLLINTLARLYKPTVKQIVEDHQHRRNIAGIVFDMFCTPMIEVAEEMGLPSYLFFTCGANMLNMMLELESLEADLPLLFSEMPPESTPVKFPGFKNLVPIKVWPGVFLNKALKLSEQFKYFASRYRKAKGILVNTFEELESDLLESFSQNPGIPPVYSVGPILHLPEKDNHVSQDPILSWLNEQPTGSVVFLCFGSKVASLDKIQVEQLAVGIKRSGYRFLWSLPDTSLEALPEGFLDETARVGKVIGWAPQTKILGHMAVAAFVSHCGWNSVLESLWFGVPIVAWPMYAEQQLNAFLLLKELELAVELKMDYRFYHWEKKGNTVVDAAEVEAALRQVMEEDGVMVREKTKEMSKLARKATDSGGSSYESLSVFLDTAIKNVALN
uniref:Glycosyltransferase n=1 Tax=Fagopyrum tataricum TaxID=62330 RepID=A0A1P8SFY8_FAGTA|nr:UGT4 [Fagopyrum tataricum]